MLPAGRWRMGGRGRSEEGCGEGGQQARKELGDKGGGSGVKRLAGARGERAGADENIKQDGACVRPLHVFGVRGGAVCVPLVPCAQTAQADVRRGPTTPQAGTVTDVCRCGPTGKPSALPTAHQSPPIEPPTHPGVRPLGIAPPRRSCARTPRTPCTGAGKGLRSTNHY